MKVICINNEFRLGDKGLLFDLTTGKTYDVIDDKNKRSDDCFNGDECGHFLIKDDNDTIIHYSREFVIPLEEWREKRINKLLE